MSPSSAKTTKLSSSATGSGAWAQFSVATVTVWVSEVTPWSANSASTARYAVPWSISW
ncbi:hypothetical protein [Maliponia aquimaris]|uniref:hypothetical protein n=1 Tax=Maliponia aquimaris TaxID=1673631 RepID=UPI0015962293|nr:hypothetical protein [Maliponia aquimaris]